MQSVANEATKQCMQFVGHPLDGSRGVATSHSRQFPSGRMSRYEWSSTFPPEPGYFCIVDVS
jgi:hypothetical protein